MNGDNLPEGTRLLTRPSAAALLLILALGAALRLALAAQAPAFTGQVDTAEFYWAGYNLVQEGEFPLPFKRAPLYPVFLGGIIAGLGTSLETVALVQHALGLGTVLLVYLLGAVAFGRGTGLLAALGAALNGALLLMEHTIMPEALFTPLLLAGVLLLLLGLLSQRWAFFLLAGVVFGLGALTRPVAQALVPLALGAALLQLSGWRSRLTASSLILLGFTVVVGPWLVRNHAVHGVAAISGGLGDSLYERVRRWDPGFEFRDWAAPQDDSPSAVVRRRVFALARVHKFGDEVRGKLRSEFSLSEAQSDAALRQAAIQVIRQEPGRYFQGTIAMFLKLALGFEKPVDDLWDTRSRSKFAQAWPRQIRFVPEPVAEPSEAELDSVETLTGLYEDHKLGGLVPLFFLLGTARCLASPLRGALVLLPLIIVTQLLLYVAGDGPLARYRYPMQPMITLVGSAGLTLLLAQPGARLWRGRLLPHFARRLKLMLSWRNRRGVIPPISADS